MVLDVSRDHFFSFCNQPFSPLPMLWAHGPWSRASYKLGPATGSFPALCPTQSGGLRCHSVVGPEQRPYMWNMLSLEPKEAHQALCFLFTTGSSKLLPYRPHPGAAWPLHSCTAKTRTCVYTVNLQSLSFTLWSTWVWPVPSGSQLPLAHLDQSM